MKRLKNMCERKLLLMTLIACFLSIFVATNASASGKIAFASDRDGSNQIYVMNADGSGVTQVTYGPGDNWDPDWSPGGSKIVFTSDRDQNLEIYVMNADGSGQTNLTNTSTDEWNPAWSPNASKIAFSSDRNNPGVNSEIYVMNADGSGQTDLTNNPAWDDAAAWSPDGFKIAFDSDRNGNSEIYVMNADGLGQTDLTNNPAYDAEPAWSPNGLKITFTSDREVSNLEIYVMNADGSGQTNLTNFPGGDDFMSDWSRNGTKIAFTSDRDNGNYEVYAMNADGSGQTNLTQHMAADYDPDWGPEELPLLYWKDYNGEAPGGYMPDIDQNQDFDKVQARTEETGVSCQANWLPYLDGNASGGSITYSDTTTDSCTFTFTGTSIRYIATPSNNKGIASVQIDNDQPVDVDLYSGTLKYQQVLYTKENLSSGQHTITITVTGRQNQSSSGPRIDVDAFDVDDIEHEYCAPVAEANSLWWLDKKDPTLEIFADPSSGTGYIGGDINHDGSADILDLVQEMATMMNTNVVHTGTTVEDEQTGIDAFLAKYQLGSKLYEHTVYDPEFSYIEEEVERSQDVKLDLGFWKILACDGGPGTGTILWQRVGGHAATVAGVDSQNSLFAISDPDNDAAESGGLGVIRPVPGGHPLHPNDTSIHNIEANASHDIYTVVPSASPGGIWALKNYPGKVNFPTQEWGQPMSTPWPPYFYPCEESMIITEIEAAVIVSPVICGNGIKEDGEECDDGNTIYSVINNCA